MREDQQMKLVKTGVAGLDEFLQGGLPPKVILLVGLPGSGNEVFARQCAYTRAKQTRVSYFTVKSDPEFVKEEMVSYGWDVTPLQENNTWKFINLSNSNSMIQTVVKEVKKDRCVVVDSLSELLLTIKLEDVIELLAALSTENRKTQQFHFMTLIKGMQDKKEEVTMEHFAEGVIFFNTNWTGDFTNRDLRIKKMRGTHIPSRKLPYSIGAKGLRIETAVRIT